MSDRVAAILEEVKTLSPAEQTAFAESFWAWEADREKGTPEKGSESNGHDTEWPDFKGRVKAIFGDRTLPGDVEKFWDEVRGE